MKKYESPELEISRVDVNDVITTSLGTVGPTVEEEFNSWKIGMEFR